jgi:chromosome partitioning protein
VINKEKTRGYMTFTIAMSNEKGGVAKTTSTLSLGAALAELDHHVLLIDLDPQANLSLALGLEAGSAETTSASVLIENASIKTAIRRTEVNNLDLVPSNSRIESAEQFLPMRSHYLSNALRNMMGTIRRVRQESNPNLAYRILVTLLDRRNRTHRNIFEQLQTTFGKGVFTTVIEIDTKLRESPIAGVPIMQYKPTSRGSQQYRVLAQELIEYAKEEASRQTA